MNTLYVIPTCYFRRTKWKKQEPEDRKYPSSLSSCSSSAPPPSLLSSCTPTSTTSPQPPLSTPSPPPCTSTTEKIALSSSAPALKHCIAANVVSAPNFNMAAAAAFQDGRRLSGGSLETLSQQQLTLDTLIQQSTTSSLVQKQINFFKQEQET